MEDRIDLEGNVLVSLKEEEVLEALQKFKEAGVESVAVCLLFSFLNPSHEKRIAELIEQELPGVNISLSHEVLPEIREFERVSTTAINAYVAPKLGRYLRSLENNLAGNGYRHSLLVMQSNGGVMDVDYLSRKPVHSLLSGPAGGVIGSAHLGGLADYQNFITVDMGGTSYDVSLVQNLQPERTTASWFSRYRLAVPMIDIHTVGAGGGSIGWVDDGGALRVGPRSAGADPGPVCYGKGGKEPTVTDANLILGYLNAENFLGGEMKLKITQAAQAIEEKIAHPLKTDLYQAANGIFKIVNHNMTNAIRVVSVQRGHDPREFSLVAFGGGGPVHAAIQARELGIKRIIVPKTAATFSALGLLSADLVINKTRSY
ncbi:MAG: hydantoinase/oxoprolinase family protein, partial [Candidatus Binatia bacterium]|nr:hydantoinase/oxoprolinase family protein [Candidatus Binatia bacterium]